MVYIHMQFTFGIHNPTDTRSARVFTDRLRKTLRPTFQLSNLGAVDGGLGLWLSLGGWDFG